MTTLTTLATFTGGDGATPFGSLLSDAAGDLFGTTSAGGASGDGTVFEIASLGGGAYASTPTTLVSLTSAEGKVPKGDLIADAAGDLFGTAERGGQSNLGTVFEVAKTSGGYASTATPLVSFTGANGSIPRGGVIADAAGDLFGTTEGYNGAYGSVFEITKNSSGYASTPTTLVAFTQADGTEPYGALTMDSSGDLFGTTTGNGIGVSTSSIFEIVDTNGAYATTPTLLATFANSGSHVEPDGAVTMDSAGDLFFTAFTGGDFNEGAVYEIVKTAAGYDSTPVTLVDFDGADGANPFDSLTMDAAGDLFGTTFGGGGAGAGTVFEIARTAEGYASAPTTVYAFTGGSDGSEPTGNLTADAKGDLFGTTEGNIAGGGQGTVFELSNAGFRTASVAAPANVAVNQASATAIAGLSVAATDPVAGETFTVTLADSNGVLSASGAGVSGSGTTSLTITGSLSQVNAALATVSDLDFSGPADTLAMTASDSLGFVGPTQSLPVTVTEGSKTFTLTTGVDTFQGGYENDTFVAATNTLSKKDIIIGGHDTNVVALQGSGKFNLSSPEILENIQFVTVSEGAGTAAPSVTLRNGLDVTVNVASGSGAKYGITITGADDASTINLGGGTDTVVVGSTRETINGGGGADIIEVNDVTIGATINGGAGASVLELTTTGAAVMGSNITDIHAVLLKKSATFTANALSGLKITGSSGADTLIAGGSGQTLTGDGGADTLVGSSAGGDTFADIAAHLTLDTIEGFVAGDVIDITNLKLTKPTTATWANNVLTVSQGTVTDKIGLIGNFAGTFSVSFDGKSGAEITYSPVAAAFSQAIAAQAPQGAAAMIAVAATRVEGMSGMLFRPTAA